MRPTSRVATLLLLSAMIALFAVSQAHAGRLFGDIRLDGKPLPEGVRVRVTQPLAAEAKSGPIADSTLTDKFGSYKVTVKGEGRCLMSLVWEKQVVEIPVFAYNEATRYDLILEKKEGKLSLRRK